MFCRFPQGFALPSPADRLKEANFHPIFSSLWDVPTWRRFSLLGTAKRDVVAIIEPYQIQFPRFSRDWLRSIYYFFFFLSFFLFESFLLASAFLFTYWSSIPNYRLRLRRPLQQFMKLDPKSLSVVLIRLGIL
ncbi:hypothetical protein BDV27DRAFT_51600 [Aspergillus caelatus]|uniref:Uncharacterized protein n=1 Tax=Aspergillus caelatus TaxID=61420 RepID=A0A5N7AEC7_9EURO|nr:uncharacterized protein BDV27DRAFT_51600 [Aspergillus caelatus]KAE8368224.1 hypothetical protein BDV27DRAFT_51600 [Aspergillus caelatus]